MIYDFTFFAITYALFIIAIIPLALSIWLYLSLQVPKIKPLQLQDLILWAQKTQSAEEIKKIYDLFVENFGEPKSLGFNEWLDSIKALTAPKLASIEMISNLRERLLSKNNNHHNEIKTAFANTLKNRK